MPEKVRLEKGSEVLRSVELCTYCHDMFVPGDDAVFCPTCTAAYHARCWSNNGDRCAVLNCPGAGRVAGPPSQVKVVLSSAATALGPLARPLRTYLTPTRAILVSWLLALFLAFLSLRADTPGGRAPKPSQGGAVAVGVALFSTAFVIVYERLVQQRRRRLSEEPAALLSAMTLGIVGAISAGLLWVILSSGDLWERLPFLWRLEGLPVWLSALAISGGTTFGAWSSARYFAKSYRTVARLLASFAVTILSAIFFFELVRLADEALWPPFPPLFLVTITVGASLGSTLCIWIGLWTGKPEVRARRLLETFISTATLAALGLMLSQLVWRYVFHSLLLNRNLPSDASYTDIYKALTIGGAVVGAAYGSSKQVIIGLTAVFRWLATALLIILALGLLAIGAYTGFSIGREFFGSLGQVYWIGMAVVGAVITGLIVRTLYRFVRGLIGS